MVHNRACARSDSPVSDCECSCGGRLHGTRARPPTPASAPGAPRSTTTPRRGKRKHRATVAAAITITIVGTTASLTASGTFDSSSGSDRSLAIQVNVDLNRVISALSAEGFGGKQLSLSGASNPIPENCADNSTKEIKKFFIQHPCKNYSSSTWTIYRHHTTAQVAFSWVEMPTIPLAEQYKTKVDMYRTGNPPGVPSTFDGRCYASHQQGPTVWTAEVQTTGNVHVDQGILQAAVQESLSSGYLRVHCPA